MPTLKLQQSIFRRLSIRARRLFKLIQIESSLACNLHCVMCPWSAMRPSDGLMDSETFARLAPELSLVRGVDLTGGGEPLLHPGLTEMLRAALAAGCDVGFSTNGMGLDRDLAIELVTIGQQWIAFSIDGANASTYERIRPGASFRRVVDHVSGLTDAKRTAGSVSPEIMLVFVMMRENYGELPALIDLAAELGATRVIAKNLDVIVKNGDDGRRVFEDGGGLPPPDLGEIISKSERRAAHHQIGLRLYSQQPQELPVCEHNPLESLFVNWEGYVSPCVTLAYAEERVFGSRRYQMPTQRFGNVREQSLNAIWESPAYREFRRPLEQRVQASRLASIDLLLDSQIAAPPTPPAGCATCYYLYGV